MHKTQFLSRAALLFCYIIASMAGVAQVTLTATSGTVSGSFTTLKAAFDAINAGTHKGDIVIKINSSTTESASASLTASAASSSSAPYYTSINIYPTTTGLSISGSPAAPLINLNGADNVTIDGRVNATGSTKSLTISNTSAVATAGTSTIRFIADATSNTVQYCTLKGASTDAAAGIIFFSTATTTGNDNNTITNNDITCAADASRPLNVVYALGTSAKNNDNNTISNNNIYNFLSKSTASQGINIDSYNSGFTISDNNFYQTASFTATSSVNYNVIRISAATGTGNGFTVSGNYIGGSAASCGGTAWTKTAQNTAFTAISVTTATGTANSIQGNTIQNFSWTNAGVADFTGISLSGATVANIGTVTGNTIGAATGTASITYTSNTTAANFYGINIASTGVVNCQNNIIGAINAANAAANATNFFGIVKSSSAGATTISSNTIGSTATASSIHASSVSSGAAQSVYGIQSAGTGIVTISGNTVANMVNATSNTAIGTKGVNSGIYVSAGTNTISDNVVRDLSNSNADSSIAHSASVSGITILNLAAASTVRGNTIYNLSNRNISFTGGVIGIYYHGSTNASTVSRNFIHSLSVSSSSTTADLYGIKINAGSTTYSNNIISLGGDTKTDIFGIYQTGVASNNNSLYYNTVYISGSLASGATNYSYALFSTGTANTRNFRNNILMNARSTSGGSNKHCALYLSELTNSPTLDYNNYYVSGTGGVLGLSGSVTSPTAGNALPFITAQDNNSIVTNPTFINAGGTTAVDYTPTVRGTGVTGTGITLDYGNDTRGTSVSMGAFEVQLPPLITSFSPISAIPGDVVTLTGTRFNLTAANNIVFFGAARATVNAATLTSLTVTVPSGATYSPITLLNTGTVLAGASLSNFNPIYSPAKASMSSADISAKVDFNTGTTPQSVAIGDLDGDGKLDLVVANSEIASGGNTVSVLRNTSTSGSIASGSFATKVDFTTGTQPYFVAIGDLDLDGKPDLAVANFMSNSVSVFRNTSTSGTIDENSFAAKVDFTTGSSPSAVAIGDLDGDGKPDLAVANTLAVSVSVFRNTSTRGSIASGSFATKVDFTTGIQPRSVAIGDLDGDGKPDLALANYYDGTGGNSVSVLRNTSTSGSITSGSFAAKVDFTTGPRPSSVAIGDLDGDGKADLAVTNYGSTGTNGVSVFRNTSTSGSIASGSFATKVDLTTQWGPYCVAIGDLDGDAKPDLAVVSAGYAKVSVYRNISTSESINVNSFAAKVDFTTGAYSYSVAIGDLDGDGKPDLAVANSGSTVQNTVSVLRNADCTNPTSGGTIAASQGGPSGFNPAAFTSSAAASGQSGTLEYKWQSSTTSSSTGFSDIASTNSASYDADAITQTTWYKRLARVSCVADWSGAVASNVLEVTVCGNPTSGGTIAAAQSGFSPFNPAAFTNTTAASGQSGTLEYKWQSSTTSSSTGFSDITSTNSDIYDAVSLTQTTWYKRLARVSCKSDWTGAAESNVLEVTVCGNPTSGGTIAAAQSGSSPFNPAAFTSSAAASGHSGTLEYKWQSSTTSSSSGFSDIASSNSTTYDAGSLTQTTWYKRLARVSCKSDWTGAAESNVLEITVCTNPTSGGTIATAQSGNSPFDPSAFTSSAAASGHTGTLEYKWQSSTTGSSTGFSDITGATSAIYDPGALTQTTWFKRLARVSCKSDWTGAAESNVLQVTVSSIASEPTAQPTALYFTTTGSGPYNFVGNFTASGSASGYLVVRSIGSVPTFTPTDGTAYTPGSQTGGEIVYSGAATSFTESSVTNDLGYYYTIYAFNGSGGTANYLTTSPLTGLAVSRSTGTGTVSSSLTGTSMSFPAAGATVNFPAGTSGTNLTVTKTASAPSSNIQVSSSIRGMKPVYFTVTSSSTSPGNYTLILDFSGLGTLTPTQWNSYKITKRADASSPWVDVTTLGATIVNRQTDGVWGKFTISGLSSFSEFGVAEIYDGVLVSNLDQPTAALSVPVSQDDHAGQAFITDGIRYNLSKVKLAVDAGNATKLRVKLYGANSSDGSVNSTSPWPISFGTPTQVGTTSVYEFTPSSTVKLEPNTQYWVMFYTSDATTVDLEVSMNTTETGPASYPANLSVASNDGGATFNDPDGLDPIVFSVEATEVTRTWTGGSSTVWSASGNWSPSETPGNGEIMTIPNVSNDPVLDGNIAPANLIVASGTVLNMADKNITLTQGFSNDGSLTSTTGKLILAGTSAQGIVGTGSISRLEVNNSAGAVISAGSHMQTITGMLTPTAGTLSTNGNLTLNSDATGTARVGAGSASGGYITGDVITQRHLTKLTGTGRNGRAWRLVSVPVEGTGTLRDYFMAGRSGADLTISANRLAEPDALGTVVIGHNQPDAATATGAGYDWIGVAGQVSSLRYYTQSSGSGSFASAQVPSLSTTYTAAAQGYMLFSRGDRQQQYNGTGNSSTTKLQATGTLKQGTQNITIPALATAGYVLVGNPYMAVIDMEQVYNDNSTIIDPIVYVWDANSDGNTYKQGGYRTITRTGPGGWTTTGGGANPQYIESHAAFFVRPTAAGGTLQIKEAHKVTGTPGIAPHGADGNNPARLFVNLEIADTANRRLVDGAVVFFDTQYKEGLGDAVDIASMSNITAGAVGLKLSGLRLAMEGRPWPADSLQRSIPVDMRNLGDDPYLLRLIGESLTKDGFRAWLVDRHLKTETEVKVDGELLYPFRRTSDAGIDSGRFEIVYRTTPKSTGGTVTPDDASETPSVKLFPNPSNTGDVKLSLRAMAPGAYTVQVLDMLGREVATGSISHQTMNGEYRVLKGTRLSPGQYIIRLIDADKQPKETLRMVVE